MFDQNQVLVAAAIVFLGLSIPEPKETNQSRSAKHSTEEAASKKKNGYHCNSNDHKDNVTSKLST